jgi:hyperosmotically inducible periplasmic protein
VFTVFKRFSMMVGLAALCASLAGPAIAADRDEQIARDVTRAIRLYSGYEIFDWVEGHVENGIVTLSGAVRLPQSQIDYTTLARRIPGVTGVQNHIRVLPLSTFDDQIRRAAALAIYRDPNFAQYVTQANPSVHILVENGRIELKGVVLNELDKRLVGDRVRNSIVAFELKNNLEVESTS